QVGGQRGQAGIALPEVQLIVHLVFGADPVPAPPHAAAELLQAFPDLANLGLAHGQLAKWVLVPVQVHRGARQMVRVGDGVVERPAALVRRAALQWLDVRVVPGRPALEDQGRNAPAQRDLDTGSGDRTPVQNIVRAYAPTVFAYRIAFVHTEAVGHCFASLCLLLALFRGRI